MQVAERSAAGAELQASVAERGRQLRGLLRDPLMWFAAAGAIFLVANSLTLLTMPLSRDEGTFLIIAQEVLHGRLPYRDVVDQKAPAIYYLLAAFLAVTRPLPLAPVNSSAPYPGWSRAGQSVDRYRARAVGAAVVAA